MKYLLLILLATGFNQLNAQQLSAAGSVEWNALRSVSDHYKATKEISEQSIEKFPVYRIHSSFYVSLFGKTQSNVNWSSLKAAGVLVGSSIGNITTIKVPLEKLSSLDFSGVFSYMEIPAKAFPHLKRAVEDTRADSVQRGINLPEAFTGKDVFIGITDWGFDYTHPMFYDTLLQTSRVFAAWDQYKQSGSTPSGYSYGVEYDSPSELAQAGSDTANIYSYNTHGTHVGGIAGGSGAGLVYRGFAFESKFLFTTFLIDAASVIDGFSWMKQKADAEGKRLVINMSWGLYYMGTLDGNSLLSQAMATLSDQGVVFVASAGNNGDVNFHIKKTFSNNSFSSTINFYSYAANSNNGGQSITMWGEENHPFSAGLEIYNSTGTLVAASPIYTTVAGFPYLDSILVTGTDTISFNLSTELANPLNNRPNMRLRVKNTHTPLKVVLKSSAADGTVHYWNVTELTTGVGNWGMPFSVGGLNQIAGDALYSIGEPACSPDVISVAAYNSGYFNSSGTPLGGALASFTSTGPLYTEEMKPDIAAPGVSVVSSISSFTDAAYTTAASTTFNGTVYDFARFSGTSMSSPCVAGIVALILDANPALTPPQVKSILKTTARLDNHTGAITAPGDTRWGMGKVNAYKAVIAALNTVSVEELESDNWLVVYPNPTSGAFQLLLPGNALATEASVIASDGKRTVKSLQNNSMDCSGFAPGTYFVEVSLNGKTVRTKFIKL